MGENIAANTWGDKLFYNPSGTGKKKTVYMYCSSVPTLQSYTFGFAKATVRVYPSMVNDFKAVDSIGEKTANNIYEFIHLGEKECKE